MKMTLNEIRKASAEQFAMEGEGASEVSETAPATLTPTITDFAASLKAGTADFVPVMDDPHGLYGWCSDGWTCFRKVESFPEVKGELDDEATTVYKGIRG